MALRFVGGVYSGEESGLLLPVIRVESCNSEIMEGLSILVHFLPIWARVECVCGSCFVLSYVCVGWMGWAWIRSVFGLEWVEGRESNSAICSRPFTFEGPSCTFPH